jgi:hypothetical protein
MNLNFGENLFPEQRLMAVDDGQWNQAALSISIRSSSSSASGAVLMVMGGKIAAQSAR